MTQEIYTEKIQNFNTEDDIIEKSTTYSEKHPTFKNVKCSTDLLEVIRKVNKEYGLSLEHDDVIYLINNATKWNNPLFIILDLAQSNSEHCRHHFFNGNIFLMV